MFMGLMLCMEPASTWSQDQRKAPGGAFSYTLSYTPIYQFETDLDQGGAFSVMRHDLRLGATRTVNSKFRIGLGIRYTLEQWDFDGRSAISGTSLWTDLHRFGIRLPLFYVHEDPWIFQITPTVELSGESGADLDESLIYGGILSLARSFGRELYLGLGFGLFSQLEETALFPFIAVGWTFHPQVRITNPFPTGPAGPAGLELIFTPAQNWEIGVGGAYRSQRFRLTRDNDLSGGIGEHESIVSFLRIHRKLKKGFSLDLAGGILFDGRLSTENADGDKVGSESYASAPFAALTVTGRF